MPTEAERNYEIMRMATREVQAAMERAAGEVLRERELADTLGRAVEARRAYGSGEPPSAVIVCPAEHPAGQYAYWCAKCVKALQQLEAEALRQWREARRLR